jgi:hypothetical protein
MSETLAALEAAFLMAQASPVVVEPDVVTIPYGEIISAAASYIATALIAVSMWALRFVPGQIRAMLMTMRVDQLLGKAIAFGVNATAGAVKDKVLTIEVSNRVLREALSYALLHGGPLVKRFAGSPVDIAEKLWARLEVAPEVSKPNFEAVASAVTLDLARSDTVRAEKALTVA